MTNRIDWGKVVKAINQYALAIKASDDFKKARANIKIGVDYAYPGLDRSAIVVAEKTKDSWRILEIHPAEQIEIDKEIEERRLCAMFNYPYDLLKRYKPDQDADNR